MAGLAGRRPAPRDSGLRGWRCWCVGRMRSRWSAWRMRRTRRVWRRRGLQRAQQHVGVTALQSRLALHGSNGHKVRGETKQQLLADIDVGDFPPAELHHGLDAIAFLQKPDGVVPLEVVIVVVRVGAKLY